MSRFAALPISFVAILVLSLAACSRTPPNKGLNGAQAVPDTTGAGRESGPIRPGSMREFSARVGDTVYFSTDSARLSRQAQTVLIAQAQWLNRYSNHSILVEGHADERGTREYNLALGAKRAESVRDFLLSRGVEPRRIRMISYGKERPVALCANISCWSKNRRAVTVLDQKRVAAR
jgi:peptidoglycan-associated lipoprotein